MICHGERCSRFYKLPAQLLLWSQWVKTMCIIQQLPIIKYVIVSCVVAQRLTHYIALQLVQPNAGSLPLFYCKVTVTCMQCSALVSVLHHTLPPPLPHSASCNTRPYVFVHISKWASWHRRSATSASCRRWSPLVQVMYVIMLVDNWNKYFELKNSWGADGAPQTRTTC